MLENKRPFVLRTIQYLNSTKTAVVLLISLYCGNDGGVGVGSVSCVVVVAGGNGVVVVGGGGDDGGR